MGRIWDKYYPLLLAVISIVAAYLLGFNPKIKGLDNVLDGFISFSSIVLGFVAALLAIILGISKSAAMTHLYNYVGSNSNINGKNIMYKYFQTSLISGFITVIISIYMFIVVNKEKIHIYDTITACAWLGIAVFFVFSSYRIVSIIMYMLFKHDAYETSSYQQETQPVNDYDSLRERNTRNIDPQ
ncbi:hypothetical protein ACN6MY_03815 [Peribacillus sp. B-H-3]|uniref:hypothetical protein n=1 Tax=Peribacillus sp. B-H-3 TaxID=3400420 RepID=UPI003B0247BC